MPVAKPKLEPEVEAFYKQLIEKGELNEASQDLLNSLLSNEKIATEFKVGLNARSLTDRKLDEAKLDKENFEKKLKEDYDKKMSELALLQTSLSATSTSDKTRITQLETSIRQKEDQLHKVIQTARKYETGGDDFLKEVGLSEADIYKTAPPPKEPDKKESPTFSKDDLLNEIKTTFSKDAQYLAKLPFAVAKMQMEYRSLTGKDLDPDELLSKIVEAKSDDYYGTFVKSYDIENLKKQKQEDSIQAQIKKGIEEGIEREKAKHLIPSAERRSVESDFYKSIESTRTEEEKKEAQLSNPLGTNDGATVISDAVQMFTKLAEKKEAAAA